MDGSKGQEVITPVGQCFLFWWISILGGAAGEGSACVVGGGRRKQGWRRAKYSTCALSADTHYI